MRVEMRVCQQCLEGDHGNEERQRVLTDMVEMVKVIREHKDILGFDEVHICYVHEDGSNEPELLPVVTATVQHGDIALNDTQLVAEGDDGNMLVYPNPDDILTVLSRNIDEINKVVDHEVTVDLSPESAEMISANS